MTESLPAHVAPSTEAKLPPSRSRREAVEDVVGRMTLHALPRMPDRLKRLMLGGRSLTIDGNTLDVTLQLMLATQRLGGSDGLILSEDVASARRLMNAMAAQFPRAEVDVASTDLSLPGPAGQIPARHYRPKRSKEDGAPLLVYYHGGGFVVGGFETHGHLCEIICHDAGVHVLFVDYRLAPEHKAPAAVDDAYAAYRWAVDHAAELGADPSRIAVGGDSAGGNLAAVVAQRARDDGAPPPVLQLLLYPITNYARPNPVAGSVRRRVFPPPLGHGLLRRQVPQRVRASIRPIRGCRRCWPTTCPGCRPPLLITAGFDPLRDEGRQYAEALSCRGQRRGRAGVRFADPRFRQLLHPRRRQRDGDRRHHFGPARTSQPRLTDRREPRRYA